MDAAPRLRDAEIHVWRIAHRTGAGLSDVSSESLSAAEQTRANAYSSATQAACFIEARITFRGLLGRYLEIAPADVPLWAERHQKPRIDPRGALRDVRFSMSHRADLTLIAVADGIEVGIDLEHGRSHAHTTALERTVLTAEELSALETLTPGDRHDTVLRLWVRREAVLKADGHGLRLPPAHLRLGAATQHAKARLVTAADRQWNLWDLTPWPDALAAIAAATQATELRYFTMT